MDDMGEFAQAIAASNAVVWLHCEPWHNPWVAQRVWCIYEVIQSLTKREGSCRTPVQRPHLPMLSIAALIAPHLPMLSVATLIATQLQSQAEWQVRCDAF
jgi:hypothetical protein